MARTNNNRKAWIVWSMFVLLSICIAGCTQKVLRFRPPPAENPGLKLPAEVRLTLKSRAKSSWIPKNRRSDSSFAGDLEAWENGILTVSTDRVMEIPAERIETMEVVDAWGNFFGLGCLAGGASAMLIQLLLISL